MNTFLKILVCLMLPIFGNAQNTNLEYFLSFGPTISMPKISDAAFDGGDTKRSGKAYLGFDFRAAALKEFDRIRIQLSIGSNLTKYGFSSDDLIFPEDAQAMTRSSILATNSVLSVSFGLKFGHYISDNGWFIDIGPNIEHEINNNSYQKISFGYNPSLMDIKDEKDDIYESGTRMILDLHVGKRPVDNGGFGFTIGPGIALNKHKYYSTGWNVRQNKFLAAITYYL